MTKNSLKDMKNMAKKKNGDCVSTEYTNNRTPLVWECQHGHRWTAKPNDIRNGSWCPRCSNRVPLAIKDMQRFAVERGGKCLSTEYIHKEKLVWECSEGHVWEAYGYTVKGGSWCPECFQERNRTQKKRRYTIKDMQEFAESKKGKCLSRDYHHCKIPLIWECEKGHQWEGTWNNIKYGKTWCPECAITSSNNLDDAHALAKEMGGECLSEEYLNSYSNLTWKCDKGHIWQAPFYQIKKGRWCGKCSKVKGAFTIGFVIEYVAEKYGGKTLSTEYINTTKKMLWECKEGHQWSATFADIRRDRWCKECKRNKSCE